MNNKEFEDAFEKAEECYEKLKYAEALELFSALNEKGESDCCINYMGLCNMHYYGLRRSEIVGLRWESIDFERNAITIEHSVTVAKYYSRALLKVKENRTA